MIMLRRQYILFLFFIFATVIIICPDSSLSINDSSDKQQPLEDVTAVNRLRFWSNPNYTRIAVDLDHETRYTFSLRKINHSDKASSRLSIDIKNSKLKKGIRKHISIYDEFITEANLVQNSASSVSVLIDIKTFKSYKIFSIRDPFRIVVDVWGATAEKADILEDDLVAESLVKLDADRKVRLICIDAGFGGHDLGAQGYLKGVFSKDVNLKIAKKLSEKFREKLQIDTIMTRNGDKFISLEDRVAIANSKQADLFISLHTDASENRLARGISTYFLNLAPHDDSISAAAMENTKSEKSLKDLQRIVSDLLQNAKIHESQKLAETVQNSLIFHMADRYPKSNDRGTKQAPFYVLLGAQMPAIVIATGFVSNPQESEQLIADQYQNDLCEGIVKGIQKYIERINK